ncbi:hypothetical protein PsorP6_012671 [Peronosclerospora sorghi]|uniref:Uncharacterized protein n=1 Tax=Peronosclerospora sorghi TaxID=230839 RepID=A0ACC0WHK1_9STRA|nr:hypothetical protein PsorP6_012671 [Peronosclerospora sorghi]
MRLSYLGLATMATLFASYGPLVAAIRDSFENADTAYTVSTGNDFPQEERAPSRLRLVGRGNMKRTMAFPPNTQAATALYNYLKQYVGDDLASRYHHSNQVLLETFRQLHGQGLTPSDLRDHFSNTEYNIDNHPEYIPALFYDLWEEASLLDRVLFVKDATVNGYAELPDEGLIRNNHELIPGNNVRQEVCTRISRGFLQPPNEAQTRRAKPEERW